MSGVYKWCSLNQLTVHEGKTKAVILNGKNFIGLLQPITFGNKVIDYKKFSDCLGVRIDSKLSWKPQIVESCKRYNKKIKMLRHLKFLPKEALETIYSKTVIPCVTYGIAVWGSCSSSLLDDLESIHIRAARVIHNIPKRVKKHDILSYVGWQSLKHFYTKRLLILAHSTFYGSGIPEMNSLIEKEHTN